jgi:hypothetical protein
MKITKITPANGDEIKGIIKNILICTYYKGLFEKNQQTDDDIAKLNSLESHIIKDISNIAQESLKGVKMKIPNQRDNRSIIENYFEPGVYNLAVSTEWTLTETGDAIRKPFLNKKYTCGANPKLPSKLMDILVVTDDRLIPLRDIIAREPTFDCKNDYSSITTLKLVDELSKVIDDLEHVIIIDTSCSKFTPSIIKELFKEMPHESTPHKHRKTGLLRTMTPSPDKSIKTKQTKTEKHTTNKHETKKHNQQTPKPKKKHDQQTPRPRYHSPGRPRSPTRIG